MNKDDLLFILNTAADLSGHQANGWSALSQAQDAVKAYVADKEELQDPEILGAVDRLLKISSASQVPGVFKAPSFDLSDYVDPEPETRPYPEPVPEPIVDQPVLNPLPDPEEPEPESVLPTHPSATEADDDTQVLPTEEPKE